MTKQTQEEIKQEKIEQLVEIWKNNPQWTEARIARDKLRLESSTVEQINKQLAIFSSMKQDNDFSKKMDKASMSPSEIKEHIESYLEKGLESQEKTLHKKLYALVAESIPIVKLQIQDAPVIELGVQHKQFKKLLGACMTRSIAGPVNVWLTGPAGSGKTKGAENVAKALGVDFYFNGAIDTPYKLMGFKDAKGEYQRTAFRDAYENGGVYLFDEVDASLPPALLAFNAALANGYADFPDGRINRHPDCYIIAAANTWGTGPNSDYVGRNKLDAAFLDRFVQIAWGYDNDLEKMLAAHDEWTNFVQAVRENAMKKGVKVVISPRASISGGALLKMGMFSVDEVIDMTIKKGMSQDNWNTVVHGISTNIDVTDGGKYTIKVPEGYETAGNKRKI